MYMQNLLLSLKAAREGMFSRPLPLLFFVVLAIVAPFLLLTVGASESNNLPWYFWTILAMLLVVVLSVAFLRFARESRGGNDISISPGPRLRESRGKPEKQ